MAKKSNTIPRIFLSYSHRDSEFGAQLVKDLRQIIGTEDSVWYDEGIRVGDTWWLKIMRELTSRNIFIVVLSPDALKSNWVREEILTAWKQHIDKKMQFLPILYRPYRKLPAELVFLSNRQYIPFLPSEIYEEAFKKLLDVLKLPLTLDESASALGHYSHTSPTYLLEKKSINEANNALHSQIQQAVQCMKEAYDNEDWYTTVTIADALIKYYVKYIPPLVYEIQTFAYLYKYAEKLNKYRYDLAQTHLNKTLLVVKDPTLRLEILDAYVLILMQQDIHGKELMACVEEACRLAPQDANWKELQHCLRLKKLDGEPSGLIAKRRPFISKKTIFSLISIAFFVMPLFHRFIKNRK